MHRILYIFTLLLIATSCTDDDPTDADVQLCVEAFNTAGIQYSSYDSSAAPVEAQYKNCIPMQFTKPQNISFKYRILLPLKASNTNNYPLVIYLHGFGSRGYDNAKHMEYPVDYFIAYSKHFPAYYLFPQCPEDAYWSLEKRPTSFIPSEMEIEPESSYMGDALMTLIAELSESQKIDTNRIYLIGFSMGAISTLDLIVRHPQTFAAAISFCGTINPQRLTDNIKTSLRLYHSKDDGIITVLGSRNAYQRLYELGVDVAYFESSNDGHSIFATKNPEILTWLFSQNKNN